MSYNSIAWGLTGKVPNTPLSLNREAVRDAIGKIYDEVDWSFQRVLTYANWLAPGQVVNTGTFTTTPCSPQVIADATATAVLRAYNTFPPITQLQFRNPAYSIYNIIAYDYNTIHPGFVTLTLDRPWLEPLTGPGQSYMIYQCYFPAPLQDFRKFIEVRDTTNAAPLDFWTMTQGELAQRDPQRTQFADPAFVVPAGVDQRSGSSTAGWQMFELWPHQLSKVPYSFSFRRRGAVPVTSDDFISMSPPYPITEELVEWRSLEVLYQWAEAQKDKTVGRGSGANWLLLAQMANKEYMQILDRILSVDLNLNGEAITRVPGRGMPISNAPYSNQLGGLNIGGFPGR